MSDIYNLNLDYGNVSFTHSSRFLSTFLYELPFGKSRMFLNKANAFVDGVVGGWQLSGVMLFQTGPFMTVIAPGRRPRGQQLGKLIRRRPGGYRPGCALVSGESERERVD